MHVQGPNFLWSVDGYDKLRHWGFYIHGCIDAYSRYIIWLNIGVTNKQSRLILKYYLDAIKELNGTVYIIFQYILCICLIKSIFLLGVIPRVIRADLGVENTLMAPTQMFFRENHNDTRAGPLSWNYGSSISNQRIEAWWSLLRKYKSQFWIEVFTAIEEAGEWNYFDLIDRLVKI